jgi:hypothetical protein
MEKYMGLMGQSTWVPEHSISLGKEAALFDDSFDSALYYGYAFS